jgi:radical SAM superfamily enzyme YgiQ (UPF0313 family)
MEPKITLVELAPTEFGKLDAPITRDVYYRFNTAPRALPLLHAILVQEGYTDVDSIYPKYSPHKKLSKENWERIKDSDFLLLSGITRTHYQTMELVRIYKKMNPEGIVILGGPHATYLDEECLKDGSIDVIVRREGDNTLPELMQRLSQKKSIDDVLGISFRDGSEIIRKPDRPPLTEEELSELPHLIYDNRTARHMRIPVIITSRGCPFDCDFCSVTNMYGSEYRKRSVDSIVDELKSVKRRYLFVGDDNFAGNPKHTDELLGRMIDENIKHLYGIQIDVHSAVRPGLAEKMKKAGVKYAFVGFEALNKESLDSVHKKNSQEKNENAARALRKAGIWNHGMFIVGLPGQDKKYNEYLVRWAKEFCDSAQFCSIVPFSGTRLTKKMDENRQIISKNYNLYDGHHVLTIPEDISPYELQIDLPKMHMDFYSSNNPKKSPHPIIKRIIDRYGQHMAKSIFDSQQTREHTEFLRKL